MDELEAEIRQNLELFLGKVNSDEIRQVLNQLELLNQLEVNTPVCVCDERTNNAEIIARGEINAQMISRAYLAIYDAQTFCACGKERPLLQHVIFVSDEDGVVRRWRCRIGESHGE